MDVTKTQEVREQVLTFLNTMNTQLDFKSYHQLLFLILLVSAIITIVTKYHMAKGKNKDITVYVTVFISMIILSFVTNSCTHYTTIDSLKRDFIQSIKVTSDGVCKINEESYLKLCKHMRNSKKKDKFNAKLISIQNELAENMVEKEEEF